MKNRANTAMAILSNTTDLEEAYVQALKAEGSAYAENEKYLDSIQGKIDQFNNAVQTMWSNALDDSVIKGVVALGTELIKIIDNLGVIQTLFVTIGGYFVNKNFGADLFGTYNNKIPDINTINKKLQELKRVYDAAKLEYDADGTNAHKRKKYEQAKHNYELYDSSTLSYRKSDEISKHVKDLKEARKKLKAELKTAQQELDDVFENTLKNGKPEDLTGNFDQANKKIDELNEKIKTNGDAIQKAEIELQGYQQTTQNVETSGTITWKNIGNGIKSVTKAAGKMVASMLAMYAVTTAIELVGSSIELLWSAVDNMSESAEEAQEKLQQMSSEISDCDTEIRTLESELSDTKERIDELLSLGTLTYVEQEELERLQSTTAELERQIELKKTLQGSLQQGANAAAQIATNKYLDTSFSSEKSKSERQEDAEGTGETIGQAIGLVGGGAIVATLMASGTKIGAVIGTAVAPAVGTAIGAGAGALIGGIVGKIIASVGAGAKYDSEETVDEAIANMEETRAKLIQTRDEAFAAYVKTPEDEDLAEKYQEAEEALNTYDAAMAKHISQIQANYNAMDWETASEPQKEFMRQQADLLDKYNIAMGGENANYNALTRIFGEEASDELEHIEEKINDAVNAGEDFDLKEIFGDDQLYNAFEERLNGMGLTIQDVIDYFKQMKVARDEALETTSVTDSLSKISALEDAFNSLGDAVKEFKEDGTASADTLESLNEAFGNLDEFEDLYKVLATGEGDVAQAVTNVANAYIAKSKLLSDLTDEELEIMAARLKSLGVINAQELLQTRQKVQQELDTKLQGYDIDLSTYSTAEQAKAAIAQLMTGDILSAVVGMETQLSEQYGINLSDFVSTEEAKVKAAKEAARKIAEANKNAALSSLNQEYLDNGYTLSELGRSEGYKNAKQEIFDEYNSIIGGIDAINTALATNVGSIVDKYYNSVAQFNFSGNKIGIGRDYNEDIDTGTDKDKAAEEAFEKLRKTYENKIKLLEAQQTYLENEIEKAEAEDRQVGKAVYEEQIRLEKEKIALYEQERDALLANMQNIAKDDDLWQEYADAVWETEHAIQESALTVLEFEQSIIDLYVTAFDKIEEAYDHLENLRNFQIDDINADIEYNETTDQPIYADVYRRIIDIQTKDYNDKLAEAQDLRNARELAIANSEMKVGDEEWIDMTERIYEAEAGVKQLRNEIAETNNEMKQLYVTAFDKVKEAYDALDSLYSDRQSYTEGWMELQELLGNPTSTGAYDYLISNTEAAIVDKTQELADLEEKFKNAMANGIAEGSEEWIQMQEEIRATEKELQDLNIDLAQTNEDLKNLYSEAFNKVRDSFGDVTDIYGDQQAFVESYIDYLETMGVSVPAAMYEQLGDIELDKQEANIQKLEGMKDALAEMEAKGYTPEDEEWVQAKADIRAVEKAIWDSEVAMAEYNKRVREMDIEKFEEYAKRINDTVSELENLYDLFTDEDVANEDGSWTEEGITSLGLLYQKMEIAKKQISDYQDELEKLHGEYKSGTISEQEYNDRLTELKNGQWDAIGMYEDVKDAIVDINEARIDMIEEGINKEIEAYEELIDMKRKELDAERDLYEFRKDITSQTKDIAALERKIAAMSGSTDAATIAERTKLEAQLREAQEALDDTYYSHAMDSQSTALDDENEAYVTSKEDYIEMLREALKDVEAIVSSTMSQVLVNADTVLGALNSASGEYGITLSESLTTPWINAAQQAEAFKNSALMQEYDFAMQNDIFTADIGTDFEILFGNTTTLANDFSTDVQTIMEAIRITVETKTSEMQADMVMPFEEAKKYAEETFSPQTITQLDAVAQKARDLVLDETENLKSPWKSGTEAVNTFGNTAKTVLEEVKQKAADYDPSDEITDPITGEGGAIDVYDKFGSTVEGVFNDLVTTANSKAKEIATAMSGIVKDAQDAADAISNVGTTKDNSGNKNSSGTTTLPKSSYQAEPLKNQHSSDPSEDDVAMLQSILNSLFKAGLSIDGKYGPATKAAVKNAQKTMYYAGNEKMKSQDGLYSAETRAALYSYIDKKIDNLRNYDNGTSGIGQGIQAYKNIQKSLPKAFYAKGTTGTKQDEWAMTDEIGDELVLIPGKGGNLQYMRKGTAVIPADISANLMEWGQLNPNMDMSGTIQGVNLMTNVISKPELNLSFDALVKAEHITEETLPAVKKLVTEELEKFSKNLNYSLRRVGAK